MKLVKMSAAVSTLLLASAAIAAGVALNVQDVNLKVNELLKPFNTATTKMEFAFTALHTDAVRTLDFGFSGLVSKVGAKTDAKLDFKNVRYAYGDGTKPTTNVDVDMRVDLVKLLGQENINQFADEIDKLIVDSAKEFAADYGPAATVSATTLEKVVDADGNVEKLKLKLDASVDMAQLPSTKPVSEVEIQSAVVVITAEKTGFAVDLTFVANPLYKGFDTDELGLKEYIEALLNNDTATYDELNKYLSILDSAAQALVDGEF